MHGLPSHMTRRARWGVALSWRPHPLVAQEALDAFWVADESPQLHAPATCRARVHGQPERQAQELGPFDVPTSLPGRRRLRGLGERRWRWGGTCRRVGRRWRNDRVRSRPASPAAQHRGRVWEPAQGSHVDERTPMGRGRKHSTVNGPVLFRGRHGTGQPGQQCQCINLQRIRCPCGA
jgi:hypothetical protein